MTDNNTDTFVTKPLVDGPNRERYTVEYVRGINNADDALTFVNNTASVNATDNKEIAKRDGRVTIRLALATEVAVREGIISEEQRGAAVMSKKEYAEKFDRSPSLISRLISLGYALVRSEIDPKGNYVMKGETGESKFDLWKCLVSYGGADATSSLLKAGATAEEIIEALQEKGYGADGKKVRTGNTGGAGTPRFKASSSKDDGTAVVTDAESGKEETLDVSKNAVRLAMELRQVWEKAGGVNGEKINRHDMSIIRDQIAPLLVTPEEAAAAEAEAEAEPEADAS